MARKSKQSARPQRKRQAARAVRATPSRADDAVFAGQRPPTETPARGQSDTSTAAQAAASPQSSLASQRRSRPEVRPYGGTRRATSGGGEARVLSTGVTTLSKDEEYAFIRDDLRRLLITAGLLTVVMIGLLLVIDA